MGTAEMDEQVDGGRSPAEEALDQILFQALFDEAPLAGLWLRAAGVISRLSTYLLQLGWPAFDLALHAGGLEGLPPGAVLREADGTQLIVAADGGLMDLTGAPRPMGDLAFPVAIVHRGAACPNVNETSPDTQSKEQSD